MCRKILIVDDQEAIRDLLRMTLDVIDCQLYEADNGDDALRMVQDVKPDLLVLDVMLPGTLNGYQVCERIKASAQTRSTVVILLTARGQLADREKGEAVGADDYIVKPFSPGELRERVNKICATL